MNRAAFKALHRDCRERAYESREAGDLEASADQNLFRAMQWPHGLRADEIDVLRSFRARRQFGGAGIYYAVRDAVTKPHRRPLP